MRFCRCPPLAKLTMIAVLRTNSPQTSDDGSIYRIQDTNDIQTLDHDQAPPRPHPLSSPKFPQYTTSRHTHIPNPSFRISVSIATHRIPHLPKYSSMTPLTVPNH